MRSVVPALARSVWWVLGADTLSAVGTGLTVPFLVVYLHTVRGLALGVASLVAATIALAGLGGNPFGGWLADRLCPRTTLIIGMSTAGAGALGLAAVGTPGQAFAAAAVSGFGVATAWPAQDALLARLVAPAQRSAVFAIRHATMNAGLGTGGLVAALIVDPARPGTFTLLYVLDAASFAAAFTGLKGDPPGAHSRAPRTA